MLCTIVCFSNSSNAQRIGTLSSGDYIGITSYTSGTSAGGTSSAFHIGLESSYRLNYNTALIGTAAFTGDVATTVWEITGNGRYFFNPEQGFKFFGEAGLGAYKVKVEFFGIILDNKTYAGINLGGGVLKSLGRGVDIDLKVKYHNPFVSGGSFNYINSTLGVNVQL